MRILIASLLSFLAATTGVDAHSYLTVPSPRFVGGVCRWSAPSDQFGQLFCRGPCETTQKNVGRTHQAQRGQRVQVAWSRNNHGGGFVRLAWAPTAQSDDPNVFNNNVQKYSCYEVGNGCLADNGQPSGGGDNDGTQNTQCNTAIEIPNWLPNGKYTLQWSWYGGIFDFSDYYSCADFEITGGPNAPAQFGRAQNNAKPVFEGGDVKYPGEQACELVNTDRLGVCVREPCRDPVNNPTRNPFAAQFPYNQRKRGIPFSPTEMVMMPGRINTADSRGSSGSDGTVVPPGTPPATNPGTVNPISPPAPTGDSIQSYAGGVPATVGTTGGFNVGIQFSATAPSIIFADLLQTGTWAKFGWASSEVGTGQGQQNLRLNVGGGLTTGSNYIVNLWIVKRTEYVKDPNTAWQRAIVKAYPVTVVAGNAATYPTLTNAIDGIPGSIPRAVPRLDVGQVFSVSFSYAASTTRELQVDLLSPDYTAYFGGGSVTVPGGRGRATIDVRVTASSGARQDIMLNLVSKVPGTEWNTPGSIVKGFPVKVENTLRLASAAGDQTVFTNTTLDWGDLPADSFDNDVQARCRPISANQSVCDPMNAATSTSIAGSVIALMMVTVGAFLAL